MGTNGTSKTTVVRLGTAQAELLSELVASELRSLREEVHHAGRGPFRRGLQERAQRVARLQEAVTRV